MKLLELALLYLLALALSFAQESSAAKVQMGVPVPAGGKWTYEIQPDKLTGALYGILSLRADEPITDGLRSDFPTFLIMCGGTAASPKWINSKLLSPVVLGTSDQRSPLNQPQQWIYLRRDDKIRLHFWNIGSDWQTLFADKGSTKELINSSTARIQFHDVSGHKQVAIFSPSGLIRSEMVKVCGNSFK